MEFSDQEIRELARFFAKRFPSFEQRTYLAGLAGLGGEAQLAGDQDVAWADLVRSAAANDRLLLLARCAARQRPADTNLAELVKTMESGRPQHAWWLRAAVIGLGSLAVVGLAIGLTRSNGTPGPVTSPAEPTATLAAAPSMPAEAVSTPQPEQAPPASAAEEVAPTPAPAPAPHNAAVVVAATTPPTTPTAGVAPEPAPVKVVEPRPLPEPTTPLDVVPGRCGGPRGQLLGYWYAGNDASWKPGETTVVPGGANVRESYPSRQNNWNARARMVCGLRAGDSVRLSEPPIWVIGGAWWVPFHAGDLLE